MTDSTDYHICANSGPFTISMDPHEPDTSKHITVTGAGLPPGSTLTVTNDSTNHPHVVFAWNSNGLAIGNYTFYLSYSDDNCPIEGQQTIAYTIDVNCTENVAPVTGTDNGTIQVYPNPASTQLTISSSDNIYTVSISSLVGQTMDFPQNTPNGHKTTLNIASLPAGIYFVKVNGNQVRKFVKE